MIGPERLSRMLATASELEPGLWVAASRDSDISYPETGHRNLASVEDDSYWFRHRAEALVALFERRPPTGCVFDIGGGNGFMVRALRERGYEAILIEPGMEACFTALQRGLAPVVNGTTRTIGLERESLPSVGLFDVVEHIDSDAEFMDHVFDLLKPGGRLYLTVPAHRYLWSVNDETAGHFRRYSKERISQLVAEAQFQVLESTYLFSPLVAPAFLLRAVPHRVGFKESKANSTESHHLPDGVIGDWIERSLGRELKAIENGSTIGWGTSILLAAEKPS